MFEQVVEIYGHCEIVIDKVSSTSNALVTGTLVPKDELEFRKEPYQKDGDLSQMRELAEYFGNP